MDAGSRGTTAHAHQCCMFQSYAKTVPSRMKLTMRDPASMTTDKGSRRMTSYSNSVLTFQWFSTLLPHANNLASQRFSIPFLPDRITTKHFWLKLLINNGIFDLQFVELWHSNLTFLTPFSYEICLFVFHLYPFNKLHYHWIFLVEFMA